MENKLKLYIISHTHWDREWYETFQNYRYRLVRMMDDLIYHLENDEEFKVFHLDGQTIVLQDYLEIRPENEERLRKLISEGRIVIGPWYVMPDEFLISGEALVKNLNKGFEECSKYNVKPMNNGYVTDIFGHCSQFPQILKGFDIDAATLYRGIGDYNKDAFNWKAPDGSEVLAVKLEAERSYSNFYFAVRWPYENCEFDENDAVVRMKGLLDRAKEMAVSNLIVMMDGVDHIDIEPEIPNMIRLFEANIPDVEFVHANLDDYVKALKERNASLDTLEGTLYNLGAKGVNNQLLKNVLSSMVHIKQANDNCETLLTKYVQPLDAFSYMIGSKLVYSDRNTYYAQPRHMFIEKSWEYLLKNQPHDSICGCSLSDVHRDNEYRYRQSSQISESMIKDEIRQLTDNIKTDAKGKNGSVLIFNPSQLPYKGMVNIDIVIPAGGGDNLRFYDHAGNELDVQILSRKAEQHTNHRLRKLISFESMERLNIAAELDIPAFGYTVISYDALYDRMDGVAPYGFNVFHERKWLEGSLRTGFNTIDNDVLNITVNSNGTLKVLDKDTGKIYDNVLMFEDCGDTGDGWNYVKPAFDAAYYSNSSDFEYSVLSDGPNACVIKLSRNFKIPSSMAPGWADRSGELAALKIDSEITIVKGSKLLSVKTRVNNNAVGHRLRVLFPTNLSTEHFYTKLPYAMEKWQVKASSYSTFKEKETFVHPSQGITFICDGNNSVSVFSKGLYEVEVTDNEEHAVALTLFRSFERETGTFEAKDSKMLKSMEFEYAVSFGLKSKNEAYLLGEKWRAGTRTFFIPNSDKGTALPQNLSFVSLESSKSAVTNIESCYDRSNNVNKIIIRFCDISGEGDSFRIKIPSEIKNAYYTDLKKDFVKEAYFNNNYVDVDIKSNKIVTLAIEI